MQFTGEKRERVKGVFDALSSIVDETLYIGPIEFIQTELYIIKRQDFLSDEL